MLSPFPPLRISEIDVPAEPITVDHRGLYLSFLRDDLLEYKTIKSLRPDPNKLSQLFRDTIQQANQLALLVKNGESHLITEHIFYSYNEIDKREIEGIDKLLSGQWSEAIDDFLSVINITFGKVSSYKFLTESYLLQSKFEKAEEFALQAKRMISLGKSDEEYFSSVLEVCAKHRDRDIFLKRINTFNEKVLNDLLDLLIYEYNSSVFEAKTDHQREQFNFGIRLMREKMFKRAQEEVFIEGKDDYCDVCAVICSIYLKGKECSLDLIDNLVRKKGKGIVMFFFFGVVYLLRAISVEENLNTDLSFKRAVAMLKKIETSIAREVKECKDLGKYSTAMVNLDFLPFQLWRTASSSDQRPSELNFEQENKGESSYPDYLV